MTETNQDKLDRLRLMASGDDKWDLSDKDQAAIDWILRRVDELEAKISTIHTLRPAEEWYEEIGEAIWWYLPIIEGPYVGSPMENDWHNRRPNGFCKAECYTHWSPLPDTRKMTASDGKKVGDE